MPPMPPKCRYSSTCVGVSLEGRRVPSTTLPSRSTTTMCSGRMSSYGTPLGLITTCRRSSLIPLTLPQVSVTRPKSTSSRFASQTCSLSDSSIGSPLAHTAADGDQSLHDLVEPARRGGRAECVMKLFIKRIQFRIHNGVGPLRAVSLRFDAGPLLLRLPDGAMRTAHHG